MKHTLTFLTALLLAPLAALHAAKAEQFIDANQDRAFFLNLWCYGVHGPCGHKPEYTAEFARTTDPRGKQGNPIMASMLRSGKGRLYEGGIRAPLMVRWPGKIAPAATSDAIVGCYDIYPTVLNLVGLPFPPQQKIDGISFAPVLRGAGNLLRDAYFIWFPHLVPGISVRKADAIKFPCIIIPRDT